MPTSKVYVIQVIGGREKRAREAIARELGTAAEDVYLPSCEVAKKVHGTWRRVQSLLFPGYVFVQTEEPRRLFESLRKVGGHARMLGVTGGSFDALTDDEVAWLDAVTDSGGHVMGMSEAVQEGDRVIVTDGPLRGRETQIVRVDRHKRLAWIRVSMLGRETTVKVGLEVVRKHSA